MAWQKERAEQGTNERYAQMAQERTMMPTTAPPTAPPILPLPAAAASVAADGSAMLKGAFARSRWLAGAETGKVEVGSP